jgi:tRNA(Arg) A34 adenosine deaminase TadA
VANTGDIAEIHPLKWPAMNVTAHDESLMRRAFAVARRARQNGNLPFGCLLAGPDGEVLLEAENALVPSGDMTAHAERLLAMQASLRFKPEQLLECTMITSAEPCAMCAGAVFWAGIGRVVYGLSSERLKRMTSARPGDPMLFMPCRTVFAAGQRKVEVVGPLLEDEAAELHDGVWE